MSQSALVEKNRIAISRLLGAGFLVILLTGLNAWSHHLPVLEHGLAFAGWTLIALGVVGRIWASSYISGLKNVCLVTDGPYSLTRNPLYVASFVGGLGVALVSETFTLPALFTLAFFTYYQAVVRREEARLRELHGAAFDAYSRRVPRFWPRLAGWTEPGSYTVNARKFRRSLLEVVWFVIAGGVIELIEGLHHADVLPTLYYLY